MNKLKAHLKTIKIIILINKEELIMKKFSPFAQGSMNWNVRLDGESMAELTTEKGTPVTLDYECIWAVRRNRIVGAFRDLINQVAVNAVQGL
jgi:hypothetical protein